MKRSTCLLALGAGFGAALAALASLGAGEPAAGSAPDTESQIPTFARHATRSKEHQLLDLQAVQRPLDRPPGSPNVA